MKFIKRILKILLPILLLAITMSFIVENMITKTITNEIMAKKISGYFLDNIVYDFNVDKLEKIENEIKTSKYTEKITSKYIDVLINNLIYNENQKLDISNEVELIIEKELINEISEQKKNEISNNLQEQSTSFEERLENSVSIGFTNYNFILLLKIYGMITSFCFRIIMFLLLIADIIILIILEKYETLKYIQMGILVTTIISVIVAILIKIFSTFIEQNFSGGWIDNINMNMLIAFIIIEIIISIAIYFIRKKLESRKAMKKINKKFIPIFVYVIMLIILATIFWTSNDNCGLGFGIISYYILIPLTILISSIIYSIFIENKKKYFWILFFGSSVMLFEYFTYSLANMLTFQKINMPNITTFFSYGIVSLIGMLIGNLKRYIENKGDIDYE